VRQSCRSRSPLLANYYNRLDLVHAAVSFRIVLDKQAHIQLHSTYKLNEMAPHLLLDRTLMALAHPARRAILERLSQGEVRVTTLAEPFAMSLNAVSKHIHVLERARLVRRRRAGREYLLSVNPAPLDEAASWITAQHATWAKRLDALEALLRSEDRVAARARRTRRKRLSR
jgi:DNA-binding transcriptional ArsR family regulator